MAVSSLQVKETFIATQVATRRRETFVPGELIVVVEGAEPASESQFIRLNGLRASRSREYRYTLNSAELVEKTALFVCRR